MRTHEPAPTHLVDKGQMQFGTFDGPIRVVNLEEARRPYGRWLPKALQGSRLKEWQAYQLTNGRFFIALALFNAKSLALVQAKVFDRETGRRYLFERKVLPWSLAIARGLLHSESVYRRGGTHMVFENRLAKGALTIDLNLPAGPDFPGLSGRVGSQIEDHTPLVVAMPFAKNRGMYSHKGIVPAAGEVALGQEPILFRPADSSLLMDDHKGYYPYAMRWDWIAATGFDSQGRRLGINLTQNQCLDADRFNENCLWIDGAAHLLPAITFERTGFRIGDRWQVRDRGGDVNVEFEVAVEGRVDINALVLRTDYHGPFGEVRGTVRIRDGETVDLDGLFGMGERFYLRA